MNLAFSKTWILITIVVLIAGGVFAWQYWQFKTIPSQSCGGDFSYNTQCPFGTYCKSLGQGPFAGGLCTSYLAPLFEAFPPLLSESKSEGQRPEVLNTQSSRNVVEGDLRDAVVAEELGMALKCAGVFPVLGNTIYADITGDGNEEVIVHEESCGSVGQGFKGIYTIHQSTLAKLATKEDLSSPKLVKWDGDLRELIGVNFVYETGDANCCPSKERISRYQWNTAEKRFIMISQEVQDWQTYRSEEFGFEVRYPLEYDISSADQQGLPKGIVSARSSKEGGTLSVRVFDGDFANYRAVDAPGGMRWYFDTEKKEWFDEYRRESAAALDSIGPERINADIEAYVWRTGDVLGLVEVVVVPHPSYTYVIEIIESLGMQWNEETSLYEEPSLNLTPNQILSTFRFI